MASQGGGGDESECAHPRLDLELGSAVRFQGGGDRGREPEWLARGVLVTELGRLQVTEAPISFGGARATAHGPRPPI